MQKLIRGFKKSAELKHYGIASSIAVLALEELSKATILHIKSIDKSIPIKKLKKYFTCHKTKQDAVFNIFSSIELEIEEEKPSNNAENISSTNVLVVIIVIVLIIACINKTNGKAFLSEKSFFDEIKETGFYVEFNQSNRTWRTPEMINKEDYESLIENIEKFSNSISNWFLGGNLDSENIYAFVEKLDDDIIDKEKLMKNKRY